MSGILTNVSNIQRTDSAAIVRADSRAPVLEKRSDNILSTGQSSFQMSVPLLLVAREG